MCVVYKAIKLSQIVSRHGVGRQIGVGAMTTEFDVDTELVSAS